MTIFIKHSPDEVTTVVFWEGEEIKLVLENCLTDLPSEEEIVVIGGVSYIVLQAQFEYIDSTNTRINIGIRNYHRHRAEQKALYFGKNYGRKN